MYVFPKQLRFLFLAFGLMVAFTACDNEIAQEEITPEILTEEEMPEVLLKALPPDPTSSDPAEMRRRPCFRFVFPVQVVLRDGTVITASDAEDLRAAYRRLCDAGVTDRVPDSEQPSGQNLAYIRPCATPHPATSMTHFDWLVSFLSLFCMHSTDVIHVLPVWSAPGLQFPLRQTNRGVSYKNHKNHSCNK